MKDLKVLRARQKNPSSRDYTKGNSYMPQSPDLISQSEVNWKYPLIHGWPVALGGRG